MLEARTPMENSCFNSTKIALFDPPVFVADNSIMATKIHPAKPAKKPKTSARPMSNDRLLKLAAKNQPPQSWYEERVDPTKPAHRR